MHWEFIVVLLIAIPIILLPIALAWYITTGSIYKTIQESRKRRRTLEQGNNQEAMVESTDRQQSRL